ncbi:MAG: synthase [Flaviaesturariibacter sp.]|nr:synthase [Flaviaesturariibacter sp.]
MIRIAILDMYEGHANQGMRCIRELINQWGEFHNLDVEWDEFEVRQRQELPDLSYDMYISTGGPGSPLESEGSDWEAAYFSWLSSVEAWNADPLKRDKKYILLICHSFQLVSRQYGIGTVSKRRSTSFGVFPVHVLLEGQQDIVFQGLNDPFYVVDSRDYQLTQPAFDKLAAMGGYVLCIEKYRPHVPLDQAVMGIRFNKYMIGTQFHPEADAVGMSMYLQQEDKKQTVIENYGLDKWQSMIDGLNDPEKILWTYSHIIPNFLNIGAGEKMGVPQPA